MPKTLVSFRRGDTTELARKITGRLSNYYGAKEVRDDIGYIPVGREKDPRAVIRERISDYSVVVFLIGKRWLAAANRSQERYLLLDNDPIRLAVSAVVNSRNPSYVVVLDELDMLPSFDGLPDELMNLRATPSDDIIRFRSDASFNADMRALYRRLGVKFEAQRQTQSHTPTEPNTGEPTGYRAQRLRDYLKGEVQPKDLGKLTVGEIAFLTRTTGELTRQKYKPLDLRGFDLTYCNLAGAVLSFANLEGVHLEHSKFQKCDLTGANLRGVSLDQTSFSGAKMRGADLSKRPNDHAGVDFRTCSLDGADLGEARLDAVNMSAMDLTRVALDGAKLSDAHLVGVDLSGVDLSEAVLTRADLSNADLSGAKLTNVDLTGARLGGADLRDAIVDGTVLSAFKVLESLILGRRTSGRKTLRPDRRSDLAMAAWEGLTPKLPEEAADRDGKIAAWQDRVRVNNFIAEELRKRGLLTEASDYRLKAQRAQRKILFLRGSVLAWLFSWLLNILCGYGERTIRAIAAYGVVVALFAGVYFSLTNFVLAGQAPITLPRSLVLSFAAFHGSGLLPASLSLTGNMAGVAAAESLVGLIIEVIFIATFTQRFFSR